MQILKDLPKSKTDNGARWLVEEKPDTMRGGPWNTQLYIFDTAGTNDCVCVKLLDHAGADVHHIWLNDKMLFVKVWFGRIAWTDFVLDAETRRLVYIEDGRLDSMFDSPGAPKSTTRVRLHPAEEPCIAPATAGLRGVP